MLHHWRSKNRERRFRNGARFDAVQCVSRPSTPTEWTAGLPVCDCARHKSTGIQLDDHALHPSGILGKHRAGELETLPGVASDASHRVSSGSSGRSQPRELQDKIFHSILVKVHYRLSRFPSSAHLHDFPFSKNLMVHAETRFDLNNLL